MPVALKLGDHAILVLGHHLGNDLDPASELGCDRLGCLAAITAQERHPGPALAHPPDHACGLRTQRIGDAEPQHLLAGPRAMDKTRGPGRLPLTVGPRLHAVADQPFPRARKDLHARDMPLDPESGRDLDRIHRHGDAADPGTFAEVQDRGGNRMLGEPFERLEHTEDIALLGHQIIRSVESAPTTGRAREPGHGRSSDGQRPGLVEDEMIDRGQALEYGAVLDQDAARGGEPGRHGHCHGRGHSEGTRTGDDEHGGRRHDRDLDIHPHPDQEGQGRQTERCRDKPGHDPVGKPLNRGLAGLGVLDQSDDATQRALTQQRTDTHGHDTGTVDGARNDLIAERLGDRSRLAGQHGFIHPAAAGDHLAVDRDALAGTHQHALAELECAHGNDRLGLPTLPVQTGRDLRLQIEQPL